LVDWSSDVFSSDLGTRAFISSLSPIGSLHGRGTLHVPRSAFGENAEPPRHFLVRFLDIAEVAAETVLVQLLVGLDVPQAAIVGADLVRQDDAHLVVLVEPAELQLEVDQLEADAKEPAAQEV